FYEDWNDALIQIASFQNTEDVPWISISVGDNDVCGLKASSSSIHIILSGDSTLNVVHSKPEDSLAYGDVGTIRNSISEYASPIVCRLIVSKFVAGLPFPQNA
ncbi:hypothetical protein PENTCL1PPCAC_19059, partial [Pristionchus entomophagus]